MTQRSLLLSAAGALTLAALLAPLSAEAACNDGIVLFDSNPGAPVTLTTSSGDIVNACANGAHLTASGQISVTLVGTSLTGGADGLLTQQTGAGGTRIFVDAATTVLGGNNGIEANGSGAGFIGLTIDGQITGQAGDGLVVMQPGAGAISVITDAGSNIRTLTPNSAYGVYLSSVSGGVALTLGGTSSEGGVYLSSGGSAGTQATINGAINNTVGAGLTLRSGTGNLNANINSTITATTGPGVDAASPAANPFVGVGAGGAVTGTSGVLLAGSGTGTTVFNNSGAVTGAVNVGVSVTSSAGDAQLLNLASGHIVAPGAAAGSATLAAAAGVGTATISNDGVASTAQANFSGVVASFGASRHAFVENNSDGTMLGRLIGADNLQVDNAGLWRTSGVSNFGTVRGASSNVFNNTGTLFVGQASLHATATLSATFQNLGTFRNGIGGATGTISMVNGLPGDSLTLSGAFTATTGSSFLFVDASLGGSGSTADVLHLGAGAVTGQTLIRVNDTNTGAGALNTAGILVVTGSPGASAFAIDPATAHYDAAHHGIDKGLFLYTLSYSGGNERLVSGLGGVAARIETFGNAILQIFNAIDGLPDVGGGFGGGRASFAEEGAPRVWMTATNWDIGRLNAARRGLWGSQGFGGGLDSVDSGGLTQVSLTGAAYGLDASFAQRTGALVTGADLVRRSSGGAHWALGVSGGYVESDQAFAGSRDTVRYDGAVAGLYSTFADGGLSVQASVRFNGLQARYLGEGQAGPAPTAAVNAFGGQVEARYRQGLGHGWSLEPVASISAVRASVGDLQVGADSVRFGDAASVKASVGAALSGGFRLGDYRVGVTTDARLWNEFDGRGRIGVDAAPDLTLADQLSGRSTEVGARVDVLALDGRTSAFVGGAYRFNASTSAANLNVGVRMAW